MSDLTFSAEIKKTSSKKTASLDVVYQVTFESTDPTVIALGTINGDTRVNVTVTPEQE